MEFEDEVFGRTVTEAIGDRTSCPPSFPLASARSLFSIAHPVHRLDIVGRVVSPRPSHSFGVDMVGHDVVVIGELYMAERAFPALLDNLAVEQLSHFFIGASSRYPRG
jgi:hypothetical protein